jgi:hypothetical protein
VKRIPPSAIGLDLPHAPQISREKRFSVRRLKKGERGIGQRRFWEHVIRDEGDFERYVDYLHHNPAKILKAGCAMLSRPTAFY